MFLQMFAVAALVASTLVSGNDEAAKPVILSPAAGDKVYSGDNLILKYYSQEDRDLYVILSEGDKVIDIDYVKSGRVLRSTAQESHKITSGGLCVIDESLLEPEKTYTVQVGSGSSLSEKVSFSTFSGGEEMIKLILERSNGSGLINAALDRIAPREYFTSSKTAMQMMENITVNVWRINSRGEKYSSTATLTVNKNLRNNYINVFKELYAISFPVNSLGCYNYRNTYGGRLSEHALGTAVDINPMENYCLYSDGTKVGKLWEPYKNPYSVTPEVVAVFKKYGFSWGGDWEDTPDYMHFSYFNS